MGCWGCPFNHRVQDGVGGAHLGTCAFPLFPHSLFTSSLTQTFHPLLLRTIDRPGRSPVCSRLVVADVEANARTCLACDRVSELRKIYVRLLSSSSRALPQDGRAHVFIFMYSLYSYI